MELYVEKKIESLRLQMIEEARVQGSLTHENVILISQRLDRYIVMFQKMKSKPKPALTPRAAEPLLLVYR